MSTVQLHLGDCLDILPTLSGIDAVVTDPPYGLEFMGKDWDAPWKYTISSFGFTDTKGRKPAPAFGSSRNPMCRKCRKHMRGSKRHVPCACDEPDSDESEHRLSDMAKFQIWCQAWATACLRVLKPGGYLLSFGGTRTHHRLTCSIEDAGFEIRDCLMWLYGSGYPKGKGCLKPAWEPIILARKPGPKVFPLGIEECRVEGIPPSVPQPKFGSETGQVYGMKCGEGRNGEMSHAEGRWPPNLLLTHHELCNGECHPECVVRVLGEQSGESRSTIGKPRSSKVPGNGYGMTHTWAEYQDTGTAARFYPQFRYEPKASRRDRNEGCEGMEPITRANGNKWTDQDYRVINGERTPGRQTGTRQNSHPTVKPTALMEWLVMLACPEGGTVLDPFMGSGSTGKACKRSGRSFIGIEQDPQWLPIAECRINAERNRHPLFAGLSDG